MKEMKVFKSKFADFGVTIADEYSYPHVNEVINNEIYELVKCDLFDSINSINSRVKSIINNLKQYNYLKCNGEVNFSEKKKEMNSCIMKVNSQIRNIDNILSNSPLLVSYINILLKGYPLNENALFNYDKFIKDVDSDRFIRSHVNLSINNFGLIKSILIVDTKGIECYDSIFSLAFNGWKNSFLLDENILRSLEYKLTTFTPIEEIKIIEWED